MEDDAKYVRNEIGQAFIRLATEWHYGKKYDHDLIEGALAMAQKELNEAGKFVVSSARLGVLQAKENVADALLAHQAEPSPVTDSALKSAIKVLLQRLEQLHG